MIVNDELRSNGEENVVAYLKVTFWHSSERN
jgi:hypothetical protein